MQAPCDATLLRIYIGYDDTFREKPLYEELVHKARDMGLAGASVTRGIFAYGPGSLEVRLRDSEDLPIIIDIVDSEEKTKAFLRSIEGMIGNGLVLTQKVSVLHYGHTAGSKKVETSE